VKREQEEEEKGSVSLWFSIWQIFDARSRWNGNQKNIHFFLHCRIKM